MRDIKEQKKKWKKKRVWAKANSVLCSILKVKTRRKMWRVGGKSINGFKMLKGKVFRIEDYGDDFGSNTLNWNGKEPSQGKARVVQEMMRMKQQCRKTEQSNKTKSPETHHTGQI